MLIDSFGRQITYLRVSVTDRCNFRCVYCMPPGGIEHLAHDNILRYEEIFEIVQAAAEQGVREVRLTGGEPLVRKDLPVLVGMLSQIPGIEEVSLTTNGLLLEKYAESLAEAGLKRVNISLDTLDNERFARITRGGSLETAWRGIEAAERYGLTPIKINVVLMRGINDDEVADLAKITLKHPWHIRFIELMPLQNQAAWGEDFPDPREAYFGVDEAIEKLAGLGLEPINEKSGNGPAVEYRLRDGKGRIGFISPLSEGHFCKRCNRLRLTADGYLRPCLMSDQEIPVLAALRNGEAILPLLQQAVEMKPLGHSLASNQRPTGRYMTQIGG